MKRRILCMILIILSLLLFPACAKKDSAGDARAKSIESSSVWTLGDRYPLKYSTLTYFVTYDINGEQFCLKASRNKKEPGMSARVRDFRDLDGVTFALCESKLKNEDGKASYTYYECYTGSFRYFIGCEAAGFYIESYLSMDDAIALMQSPESPKGSVKLLEVEWNANYRTDACMLEILIRPNDGGKLVKSLPASYQVQTEGDDTYYVSSSGDEIVYTDGVHSVQIRQANLAGAESVSYHTLSECKAILNLIG